MQQKEAERLYEFILWKATEVSIVSDDYKIWSVIEQEVKDIQIADALINWLASNNHGTINLGVTALDVHDRGALGLAQAVLYDQVEHDVHELTQTAGEWIKELRPGAPMPRWLKEIENEMSRVEFLRLVAVRDPIFSRFLRSSI